MNYIHFESLFDNRIFLDGIDHPNGFDCNHFYDPMIYGNFVDAEWVKRFKKFCRRKSRVKGYRSQDSRCMYRRKLDEGHEDSSWMTLILNCGNPDYQVFRRKLIRDILSQVDQNVEDENLHESSVDLSIIQWYKEARKNGVLRMVPFRMTRSIYVEDPEYFYQKIDEGIEKIESCDDFDASNMIVVNAVVEDIERLKNMVEGGEYIGVHALKSVATKVRLNGVRRLVEVCQ